MSGAPARLAAVGLRVDAESLSAPPSCWQLNTFSLLSGGSGRSCFSPLIPLKWTVVVPSGKYSTVILYGYRDEVARGYRVRVDDKPWTGGTLSGAADPSAVFYTSPVLNPGSHTFELESVASAGGFTFDFYTTDMVQGGTTTPTTIARLPVVVSHAAGAPICASAWDAAAAYCGSLGVRAG